jgi:hypothetical protein
MMIFDISLLISVWEMGTPMILVKKREEGDVHEITT